jgi:hypothetical protein
MDMDLWIHGADAAARAVGGLTAGGTAAEAARDRHQLLERRLEKLSLICQALWTLVRERTNLSEDDLARRVQEIDLSDGKLDGRVSGAVDCGACGRRFARSRDRCLYCEAPRQGASPFESV